MWLALETATDRASVAVGGPAADAVEESLDRRTAPRGRAASDDRRRRCARRGIGLDASRGAHR